MREIVFDTETTGMDPAEGHRLVEIGCLELVNKVPTGRTYHQYIQPERSVPADAIAVHGITDAYLKDMPVFASIYHEFLEFIGEDSILVAHNAPFDMKFVNAELKTVGHAAIDNKRVRDSLVLARKKFPGSPASLDALCRRFSIGLEGRELHGALLDAQLLADVWMELNGGRQHGLGLNANTDQSNAQTAAVSAQAIIDRPARTPRPHAAKPEELEAHGALVGELKDPLWPVG